jgi:DNA modification methylase
MPNWKIRQGDWIDVLRTMPDASVHCVVTSPPYWGLRDYGVVGQLGLERTPEEYVARMVEGFREVRRVLRNDGTLWLNLGDSYASTPPGNKTLGVSGSSTLHGVNGESGRYRDTLSKSVQTKRSTIVGGLKPKDLCGIPWMVAFALRADGWYLRQDIIWSKPNPMPESVRDRCTKAHEYIFLLSKSERYYYDQDAIAEPSIYGYDNEARYARSTARAGTAIFAHC